jgi:hypothetical protein
MAKNSKVLSYRHSCYGNSQVDDVMSNGKGDARRPTLVPDEQVEQSWRDTFPRVRCTFCGKMVPKRTAHRHQGKWVGDDCCWDERLRSTE